MRSPPLRWAAGDRGVWRGLLCEIEYVADDGILISYRARIDGRVRCAIVSAREIELRPMS